MGPVGFICVIAQSLRGVLMSTDRVHVYISGPLRGAPGDLPEVNVKRAMSLAAQVIQEGFVPFIPHLAWYVNGFHPMEDTDWLNFYSLPWLERCDCILRFGGPSRGADIEIKVADKLGKPVFMSIPEMAQWRESQT